MTPEQQREGQELVQRWLFCWLAIWLVLPHLPGVVCHFSWGASLAIASVIVWLHSLVMSGLSSIASVVYHFIVVGTPLAFCALCWPSYIAFSSLWSGVLALLVIGLAAAFSLGSVTIGRNR